QAVNYAVTLPEGSRPDRLRNEARHELPQQAVIDLLSDLAGVETSWRSADGKASWSGWLPSLDLDVARGFTAASEEHRRLFTLLQQSGTLTFRGQINLWSMLHPAVQPG